LVLREAASPNHDFDRIVIGSGFGVFGYENLMICDGAAIPANPGVNPSLTITALAEHAMAQVPAKEGEAMGALSV
jgi:cholesterol oxidase